MYLPPILNFHPPKKYEFGVFYSDFGYFYRALSYFFQLRPSKISRSPSTDFPLAPGRTYGIILRFLRRLDIASGTLFAHSSLLSRILSGSGQYFFLNNTSFGKFWELRRICDTVGRRAANFVNLLVQKAVASSKLEYYGNRSS